MTARQDAIDAAEQAWVDARVAKAPPATDAQIRATAAILNAARDPSSHTPDPQPPG